jgi:hypothetical protein
LPPFYGKPLTENAQAFQLRDAFPIMGYDIARGYNDTCTLLSVRCGLIPGLSSKGNEIVKATM